jgi:hypothetical protein
MKKYFFGFFLSLIFISCAPKQGPTTPHKPVPIPESRPPELVPESSPEEGDVMTPERQASDALIDDGERLESHGLYGRSADLFQEAVTVDPTNGAGYFHLAAARLKSGEYGDVEGLIAKARTLLGSNTEWAARLNELEQDYKQRAPH